MTDETQKILELATKIEVLMGFCAQLIPDIELLEKAHTDAYDKAFMALSAAPLLEACGINHRQKNAKWTLLDQRSAALINLLKVLKETEDERIKFSQEEKQLKDIRARLGF